MRACLRAVFVIHNLIATGKTANPRKRNVFKIKCGLNSLTLDKWKHTLLEIIEISTLENEHLEQTLDLQLMFDGLHLLLLVEEQEF